ncbi:MULTISPECIES: glycosyltransferase family 4 protein [Serratia]|uniref:glycosyltransferase family 4 protein n=1 Tax=Serratia TaxID=613 RepID=UPI001D0BCACA|nr:glycosyltransferase family 1 protein [Serratia marcescens]MDX7272411.1 glycosyltransferase family 1 protein [Serratia marcescens]
MKIKELKTVIYINGRFLTQELTGVQRFAEEISRHLQKIRNDIVILCPPNIDQSRIAQLDNVEIIGKNTGHIWEQYDLPIYLRAKGGSLLVNLSNTAPVFYKNKLVTHHDITYKRYPNSYSLKFKLFYNSIIPVILKTSRALITVSDFSKGEICEAYNYDPKKTHVIYNSTSNKFSPKINDENSESYFLAVSSSNFHKNFHGLIKAFEKMSNEQGVQLKIIGGWNKNFSNPELDSILENGDSKGIVFLGRVSDEELVKLYSNALAFIFPSFYEGFGIPPLEAQACGCPVASSNRASLPEVLSDSVLYFSPDNEAEIITTMELLIASQSIRNDLIERGYKNVKRFSWDNSATKLNNLIRGLE